MGTAAIARVYVNDVEVGALPADQYNRIVKDVRADRRLYVAQAMNYIGFVWRFVAHSLRFVPIFWFAALVVAEILGPSIVTDLIAAMRQATPTEVNHGICWMLGAGMIFSMLTVSFCMFAGAYPSGLVDEFEAKISRQIRSLLEVPAEGTMSVLVSADDANEQ
ncbi:hypothetical protein KTE91_28945 [Burkholderia multivorans]|uniref:hypothetical protein n=1 Tax=Burkholderia multivorans TaxID=87883 RepID=UPI001C223D64|nr:hypothetical protein [Burkholderia multivorans]MBU9439112.1 hypothetical protein [Burkholderia multivorans]